MYNYASLLQKGLIMSKYLFIVESPGKVHKIQGYLGSEYKVLASVGHIREIPKKGLGIDVSKGFDPTYEISHDKKDVVKKIKEEAKKSEVVYLATDMDREGEGIASHLKDVLDKSDQKKCKRVVYTEITKKAILKAIEKAGDINKDLADAQKARQVLDRLIGYKISPLLWTDVASKTSAGRVQSVALKLIAEREIEIKNFKSDDFWYLDANLKCKSGEFIARTITDDKDNRFLKEKEVNDAFDALQKAKYKIEKVERKEKEIKPNPPFDTASLQTTASTLFGWQIKKTAKIAQELYEAGKVTYIRSDSFSIAAEALTECRDFIKNEFKDTYLPKTAAVYKKKEDSGSQEAHECIRPSHIEDDGSDLAGDNQKLYQLIRSRFLACQMMPAIADTVVYHIKTDTKYKLNAKGQTVRFDGWMKVYKYSSAKEEILPNVTENELLSLIDLDRSKHETQPPPRYNEGSLVKRMEKDGVGRPATYPSIMEGIKNRGYVEEIKGKKGALQSTELGMKVYEYLQKNFNDFIMDIKFTAALEDDLDIIEHGKKKYLEVVSATYDTMMNKIGKISGTKGTSGDSSGIKCPICNKGSITQRKGKFGTFFSCDAYPDCKSIFVKSADGTFSIKGKKDGEAHSNPNVKHLEDKCTVCEKNKRDGHLVERSGKYGVFYGCSAYPKCHAIFTKDNEDNYVLKNK